MYSSFAPFCSYNKLSSLDLSKCKALTVLECDSNYIRSLDVSNNPMLSKLSCGRYSILDLSKNPYLNSSNVDTFNDTEIIWYNGG